MKKYIDIILALIIFVLMLGAIQPRETNANYSCGSDEQCYQQYLVECDQWTTCVNYYYKGQFILIEVPPSRAEFIRQEFYYLTGIAGRFDRAVRINIALIKRGLEPLYY